MIFGIICARGGSKGIPGKNIKIINGYPLAWHTAACALQCNFDKLIFSTDDKNIAAQSGINTELWIKVQMRPAELATDTASKWEVFRYIAKTNNLAPDDILVDLDTGCPLREPQDITACVEKLRGGDYDVVATAYDAERNPYFNMVEKNRWGDWQIAARVLPPITRRQDAPQVYSLSPAVFAIRVGALEKYTHWSLAKLGIVVIPRERAWDIDSQLDFDVVEMLMRRKA